MLDMENTNSERITKLDVISFLALLVMGGTTFLGMYFKSLGNTVVSVLLSVLLWVLMSVFVFLAAYAKRQNRNQSTWKIVEYCLIVLYLVGLVPFYIMSSKFFDIQLQKGKIIETVQAKSDAIDNMFAEYDKLCDSRIGSYQTKLESMLKDEAGRRTLAGLWNENVDKIDSAMVSQAVRSFRDGLTGGPYAEVKELKKNHIERAKDDFKAWKIFKMPRYVQNLSSGISNCIEKLSEIYTKDYKTTGIETTPDVFDGTKYVSDDNDFKNLFTEVQGFSIITLVSVLIIGLLGLVKYIFGEKRTAIELKEGDASVIEDDGGFII